MSGNKKAKIVVAGVVVALTYSAYLVGFNAGRASAQDDAAFLSRFLYGP